MADIGSIDEEMILHRICGSHNGSVAYSSLKVDRCFGGTCCAVTRVEE
jgi:hypothetical protein